MNTVPCIVLKISYVFNKQDEHNASYFPKCRELTDANSTAKLTIFSHCFAIQNLKFGVILRKRIELNITNMP